MRRNLTPSNLAVAAILVLLAAGPAVAAPKQEKKNASMLIGNVANTNIILTGQNIKGSVTIAHNEAIPYLVGSDEGDFTITGDGPERGAFGILNSYVAHKIGVNVKGGDVTIVDSAGSSDKYRATIYPTSGMVFEVPAGKWKIDFHFDRDKGL